MQTRTSACIPSDTLTEPCGVITFRCLCLCWNSGSTCSARMANANLASHHELSSAAQACAASLLCFACLPMYSGLVLPSSRPRRLLGSTGAGSAADKYFKLHACLGFPTMTAGALLLCRCTCHHFEPRLAVVRAAVQCSVHNNGPAWTHPVHHYRYHYVTADSIRVYREK